MITVTIWNGSEFAANVTHLITQGRVTTDDRHGFDYLELTLDVDFTESLAWYYDRRVYDVHCYTQHGALLFEGRLEDVGTTNRGVRMVARGHKSILSDEVYTAFWSSDNVGDWRIENQESASNRKPEKYEMDNNKRLYISLRDNQQYAQNEYAVWSITIPHSSETYLKRIEFTVASNLPTNWNAKVDAYDGSTYENLWQLSDGDGSYSLNVTDDNADQLFFYVWYDTSGTTTPSIPATSTYYVKLTAIRAFGNQTTGSVDSDDVIKDIIASSGLDSSTALVASPAVDHDNLVYEDESQLAAVDALAEYGDGSTQWVAQVWADKKLVFDERGHNARTRLIDVAAVDVQRRLRNMHNSAYATYRDALSRRLRTSDATNDVSIERYGVTRRMAVDADTTSSTNAEAVRDYELGLSAIPEPNTSIEFGRLFNEVGAAIPAHDIRGGDILKIRNLPPMNDEIDELRTGRVYRTEYDLITGVCRCVVGQETITTKSLLERVL